MLDLAQVLVFDVFANSGVGFMARPLLPNNEICYQTNVGSIDYSVQNKTDGGAPVTGTLDPAIVMFPATQPWKFDSSGYTFLWAVPGTLWPNADKVYRIAITFTLNAPGTQFHGFSFVLAWEPKTTNPTS